MVGGLASNLASNLIGLGQNHRSMEQARYMYEDSKRYNSMNSQVQRMRAAGINPQLALMNGVTGQASTPGSVPSMNPMESLDLAGLSSMANSMDLNRTQKQSLEAGARFNSAKAVGQEIDNTYESALKHQEVSKSKMDWELKNQLKQLYGLQVQYNAQSMNDRLSEQMWNAELARGRAVAQLHTAAYLPQRLQEEINLLIAQQGLAVATGQASLKQAHAAIMSAVNQEHAFDAQYGGNPEARGKFFNATLQLLYQHYNESGAREFKNWLEGGTLRPKGPFGLEVPLPLPKVGSKAREVLYRFGR